MKNFLIYRSSAGSGKTWTLVKEYIKLALADTENIRHTLAVTFTNKAADEMKSRIISGLIGLAENKEPELLKQLNDEGIINNIETSARHALNYIFHNYSYFSVSTIDSFFLKVIRSFAKELNHSIGYRIEIEEDEVLDKIVDDVFKDIGEDIELTRYIVDYTFQNIDEDKGWYVDARIKSISEEINRERYWERKFKKAHDIIDNRERIGNFIETLNSIRYSFENKLKGNANEALGILAGNGLKPDNLKFGNSGIGGYFKKLSLKESYYNFQDIKPKKRVIDLITDQEDWYAANSFYKSQIKNAVSEGLDRIVKEIGGTFENDYKKYVSARILLKTIYTVGIFNDVITKLKPYRDDNRVMLISDLSILLRSIITKEPSPFIYEKIGENYKYFLFDEFQDTSTFQWKNFLPLVINSLSENNFSLVVGDVKQSIYRWRNGNMMLLLRDLENDLAGYKENIQEYTLDTNRRSKSNIVEFNNLLFEILPGSLSQKADVGDTTIIASAYFNSRQKFLSKNKGGYVRLEFIPYEKDSEISASEKANLRLVDIVKELIQDGIRAGEILVLTRRLAELREVSQALILAGIKVVSDESLLLINSPKVKLVLSVLKAIANREDKLAKAEALYNFTLIKNTASPAPAPNLEMDEVHIQNTYSFFPQAEALFDEVIKQKIEYKNIHNRNLYEVTEYLYRAFGLNETADLYLTRFLDAVIDFASKEGGEINSFIRWWEKNNEKYSIIVPGQVYDTSSYQTRAGESVRLMTIHKAKGLESKIVIIPFANWDVNIAAWRDHIWVSSDKEPFGQSSAYLVNAETELKESYFCDDYANEFIMTNLDNLNLLYVALTRAMERLYIISPPGWAKQNINTLLKNSFEIDPRLIELKTLENIYELGEKAKIEDYGDGLNGKNIVISSIQSGDFRKKTIIKPVYETLSFRSAEKYYNSLNRGILLHRMLSYIITAEDIEKAIGKVKSEGLLKGAFEEDLRKEITEIVNDKDISQWFKAGLKIKTEAELLTTDPENPVIRPDRIVISDDKLIIIDYKTGKEKDDDIKQIKEYIKILGKAGYKNIEGFLLYLTDKKAVKV